MTFLVFDADFVFEYYNWRVENPQIVLKLN